MHPKDGKCKMSSVSSWVVRSGGMGALCCVDQSTTEAVAIKGRRNSSLILGAAPATLPRAVSASCPSSPSSVSFTASSWPTWTMSSSILEHQCRLSSRQSSHSSHPSLLQAALLLCPVLPSPMVRGQPSWASTQPTAMWPQHHQALCPGPVCGSSHGCPAEKGADPQDRGQAGTSHQICPVECWHLSSRVMRERTELWLALVVFCVGFP